MHHERCGAKFSNAAERGLNRATVLFDAERKKMKNLVNQPIGLHCRTETYRFSDYKYWNKFLTVYFGDMLAVHVIKTCLLCVFPKFSPARVSLS